MSSGARWTERRQSAPANSRRPSPRRSCGGRRSASPRTRRRPSPQPPTNCRRGAGPGHPAWSRRARRRCGRDGQRARRLRSRRRRQHGRRGQLGRPRRSCFGDRWFGDRRSGAGGGAASGAPEASQAGKRCSRAVTRSSAIASFFPAGSRVGRSGKDARHEPLVRYGPSARRVETGPEGRRPAHRLALAG